MQKIGYFNAIFEKSYVCQSNEDLSAKNSEVPGFPPTICNQNRSHISQRRDVCADCVFERVLKYRNKYLSR